MAKVSNERVKSMPFETNINQHDDSLLKQTCHVKVRTCVTISHQNHPTFECKKWIKLAKTKILAYHACKRGRVVAKAMLTFWISKSNTAASRRDRGCFETFSHSNTWSLHGRTCNEFQKVGSWTQFSLEWPKTVQNTIAEVLKWKLKQTLIEDGTETTNCYECN